MNVSAWAIKNPVPVILLFVSLVLIGLVSYRALGIDDNPDVDFPIITVNVAQAGAAASELETEVTRKVEDTLTGIEGLDHVSSTVVEGSSTTVCEFAIGTNTQTALSDVRDAISKIRQSLPQDIQEPLIQHPSFSGEPFITYTVDSPTRTVGELSELIDDTIARHLLTVDGVADVRRNGGLDREIRVALDPARMRSLGVTTDQVSASLRQLNANVPGGRADAGGMEQSIRTMGSAASVDQLKALQVNLGPGRWARLDTLGEVKDTYTEVRQKAFVNGKPAVSFSVVRAKGYSIVQTEEATRAAVEELKQRLPADVRITLIRTMADFTRAAYKASLDALVIGAVLAVIVIYLFLRNWQATLISALAIPLSVIATFAFMKGLGYTLNGITMLGLTLVVGILVDDAIVDLENIWRHISMGKSPMKAAFEATDEIGLAVVATTFTIVAVFLPVGFMGGIPGQFFKSFGITVVVSVLFSLLVARTLTPMMAAYMLPEKVEDHEGEDFNHGWRARYLAILNWALGHRKTTMAGALVIFVASMALMPFVPKGFINNGDIGQSMVAITLPVGSSLVETEKVALAATRLFLARPEVDRVFTTLGTGGNSAGGPLVKTAGAVNRASINVMLKPKNQRSLSQDEFQALMRPQLSTLPGARVIFQTFGPGGGGKPVSILLRGADGPVLAKVSEQVTEEMRRMPELTDVTSNLAELRPEVQIRPDFARCAEQGVNVATIGRVVRLATQGDIDFALPKFNAGTKQINIRVQLQEQARQDLQALGELMVPGRTGLVPLKTVAELRMGSGPVQIDRYDRARQVTILADLTAGNMGGAVAKVKELPSMKALPPGVSQGSVGQTKIMADIFAEFARALGIAVLMIYVVLVLLFGGFLHPLTIMMALPLSLGGAFMGLLVTQKEMGLMALIGIVMLMGLVTKNSILLVEYAIMARKKGLSRADALRSAGRDRLRPILMTTIAMLAGMLPIAAELGEGTERLSPMAVAVMGGLITSTLFTLVVIPAAFTFIDDVQHWLWRKVMGRPLVDADPELAASAGPAEAPVLG